MYLMGWIFLSFSLSILASFYSWLCSDLMLQRQAFARRGVSYAAMELAALSARRGWQ